MKKLLFTVIGFMFAVSTAFASPSDQMDFTTMSKADTQMLFGHDDMSQQVSLLSEDQMHQTQAQGWFSGIKRAFRSFGRAINWNQNRYRYILQGVGVALWLTGVPVTPTMSGLQYGTYW